MKYAVHGEKKRGIQREREIDREGSMTVKERERGRKMV